jgi:glyoxylase-like metal-dependent hydrolase (beta-lactamase superfamily II)
MAKRTFKHKMTIGSGADQIDLYYFGRGHTNGDAWIHLPGHRIVHSGDIFAGKPVPLIDGNNGGSMREMPETLKKAHAGIMNVEQIINGHTPAQTTWADLKKFADFNQEPDASSCCRRSCSKNSANAVLDRLRSRLRYFPSGRNSGAVDVPAGVRAVLSTIASIE